MPCFVLTCSCLNFLLLFCWASSAALSLIHSKMGTSLEPVNALKSRALEVALSPAEANALETNGITSLARLAFATCHPRQTPTEPQLQPLLHPIPLNPGNTATLKRPQTLVCNEVKVKAKRKADASTTFAGPERDARVQQQELRLTGLLLLRHHTHHAGERLPHLFGTREVPNYRRNELLQKKPSKEISIDQSQLVVKDKQPARPHMSNRNWARSVQCAETQSFSVWSCRSVHIWRHSSISLRLAWPFAYTATPWVFGCVSPTDFAGGQSCLHVSIRKNDLLEEECYKPFVDGPGTANHPESANRSFPLVATVRSDPKSFFDDQGIKPKETVKKPSQAGKSDRKRWAQVSQRQKSRSEHSSRSDQQSIRNSPETAPLLGI